MRSRLFFLLFLIGAALPAAAQFTPQGFNYQSIVRDANGNPLANQTVVLLFSIRSGAPNGPVAYSEKQTVSTNDFGLVNLVVGQNGTPLQGDFTTINWGNGAKYLTVALETTPNVFDELGSSQLMSVPYALYAQNAANAGGGGDNWGSQTVQTGAELSGNGTAATPLKIAQQGAATGQVLKWDGSKWVPQDDISDTGQNGGTVTDINTGAGLTGGPITVSGTISLTNTGVTPGSYGSATEIPVIAIDAQGRVTTASKTDIQPGDITGGAGISVQQNGLDHTITNTGDTNPNDDVTTSSTAGGDVNGPFSNLQIKAGAVSSDELADGSVNSDKLDDMGAANGQVLKWNGSAWAPAPDAGITTVGITAGTGISVTGSSPNFTVTNTGDTNPNDDLTTLSVANGDVSGPYSNLQIKPDVVTTNELADNSVETSNIVNQAVTGNKLDDMGAANGQALKWNGTTWTPQPDAVGTALPGPGIDVVPSGNTYTIINTGDIDSFDDVTVNSAAGGDISGPFGDLQIKPSVITNLELTNNSVGTANIINGAITGVKINNMGAAPGQVLKWNGTAWAPDLDNSGGDNWGAQVAVTDLTLSGNGSNISPLKVAQQGATNGQVLKWNGSTWFPATDGGDNWGTQVATVGAALTGNGTSGSPLNLAQQGAGLSQVLKWNGSAWAPANDLGDNWGSQAVWTSPELDGNGTLGSPVKLDQQGATNGQVLKWDGLSWKPANDGGDNWGAQTASVGAALTGNGTAGNPLNLAQQGASVGEVLQWSGSAWVPAAFSGDDWGAQAAVTSSRLSGDGTAGTPLDIAQQGAAVGEVLKWNGSAWVPAGDAVGGTGDVYSGGTGISVTGSSPNFVINNTGDLSNTNEIQTVSLTGDQLSLSLGGGTVTLPSYIAGTGITVTGSSPNFVINNAGDLDNTNEFQTLSLAGSQLSIGPNGNSVTLPASNTYNAGTGIIITGSAPNFTIDNTGDLSNTNEIQTLSVTGDQLTISAGNTVTLPAGDSYTAGTGISITGSSPNFVINNTGDLDNDPANELQTLSLVGPILSISGSGSSVDFTTLIGSGGGDDWTLTGTDIYNNNSGNVLIGTATSASGKLQVVNNGAGEGAYFLNNSSSAAVLGQNDGGGPGAIFTSSTGPALITKLGNVGLGVPSPAFKLDVDGDGHFKSASAAPQVTLEQSGGDFARMSLKNSGSGGWFVSGRGGASPLFIVDFGPTIAGGTAISANGDANVGIGGINNSASSRLKIFQKDLGLTIENTGNGHSWDFAVNGVGNLVLYNDQFGAVPAGTFSALTGIYTPSDRRLKKEIAAIPTGILNKFMQLQPVSYHYKVENESAKRSLGFIAQDVQVLFPELVGENQTRDGQDSYLSLNYAGFGILAVKAIQEQQQEIDALKVENEALRKRMDSLETRLERLEKSNKQ
jgi:hypothetical protein